MGAAGDGEERGQEGVGEYGWERMAEKGGKREKRDGADGRKYREMRDGGKKKLLMRYNFKFCLSNCHPRS